MQRHDVGRGEQAIERQINELDDIKNVDTRISDGLASVWVEYDFYAGDQFSHCGVDAVQLLKVPERGWQIVSIADTFERQGCASRPAPSP